MATSTSIRNTTTLTMACLSPFTKKTGEIFPCGRCYECKLRIVSGWSFRVMKEAERSSSAFFLTLTYNDDSIILTDNGFMSLHDTVYGLACSREKYYFPRSLIKTKAIDNHVYKAQNSSHLQQFFKLLRKKNHEQIKYYACGEYGTKSARPHYHVIIFNARLESLIGDGFARQYAYGNIVLDGKVPYTCESWKQGYITVGKLTDASCAYTLKYISKNSRIPMHKRDDRIKEYSLMSQNLGFNYMETGHMQLWHKEDVLNRMYIPLKDGKKIAMPRIFKEKIYTKHQRERISNHVQNQQLIEEQKKKLAQVKNDDLVRIAKGKKNDENRHTSL